MYMKMRPASSSHIGSGSALLLLALLLSAALLFTFSADSSTAEAQEEDSPRLAGPSPRIKNNPSDGQTYRRGEVIQVQAGSAGTRFGIDDANTAAPTLVPVHAGDRAALVALYNATGGPNWIDKENFLNYDVPLSEWQGVTTNQDGRVTELELWSNNLVGTIPAELGNLTQLQLLHLQDNELSGEIPAQLGNLTRLQELDLAANQLTGSIPSALGNLSGLTVLDLDTNQLSGPIPAQLGNLSNLRKLAISENGLSGALPVELGNLSNLAELYLWGNEFSGEIPSELGSLSNLRELSLQDNQLTGAIPPELGRLGNLEHLALWGNQLTGSIPPELGNLSSLRELWLENNQLTGAIPAQLGNLSNLTELNLWENQLTGTIPSELGSLSHLEDLLFAGNDLTGEIPPELGNLATLELLSLSRNNLTGETPSELGNLDNLRGLWLYDNELIGAIPPELGSLPNLKYLVLSDNRLTGAIPIELGSLPNLERLELGGNRLTGTIPAELGSLSNLWWLELGGNQIGGNQLTGTIPSELGSLSNLQVLLLASNQLTGAIPPELGNLSNLQVLNLDVNRLTGPLPSSLTNLADLSEITFGDNAGLCAPTDAVFQTWLQGIDFVEGPNCGESTTPNPTPLSGHTTLDAGSYHTCALRENGEPVCWGSDEDGQSTPPDGKLKSISAGYNHTCGLSENGDAICWGDDRFGQSTPPGGKFKTISAGHAHTCALRDDGEAVCWGGNHFGRATPPGGKFETISAGGGHDCGLRDDGSPVCWGWDIDGQSTLPTGKLKSISAGDRHTCGLRENGEAVCWGLDEDGQSTPPDGRFESISAGWVHTCGLRDDGEAVCWGDNRNGWLNPPLDARFVSISAGADLESPHTCGLRVDGVIVCWGDDRFGRSTPPTDDECATTLTGDGSVEGNWNSACVSDIPSPSDDGDRYAHYYTFELTERSEVTIALSSDSIRDGDTYLYLRRGENQKEGGAYIENDDHGDDSNNDFDLPRRASGITATLQPGRYTLEATTYYSEESGDFTLTVSGIDAATQPPTQPPELEDECATTIAAAGSVDGSWRDACISAIPSPDGGGDRYAHYYTFELTEQSEVTITLISDSIRNGDTYLYLRRGENQKEGDAYIENDDHGDDSNNDFDLPSRASGITVTLQPGSYTIEATTYYSEESGDFTLTVSGIGIATQPPTQQPESPFTLEVEDFQTHAEVGQPFILTIRMHDIQQAGAHGGISVSFPSLDDDDNGSSNSYTSSVADVEEANEGTTVSNVRFYRAGDEIFYSHDPHNPSGARHLLVESDEPWAQGDDRTLTLRITPNQIPAGGEFPIRIRGWICNNEYEDCVRSTGPDETTGTDQQRYPARELTVTVIEAPELEATLQHCGISDRDPHKGYYQPGDIVRLGARVVNNTFNHLDSSSHTTAKKLYVVFQLWGSDGLIGELETEKRYITAKRQHSSDYIHEFWVRVPAVIEHGDEIDLPVGTNTVSCVLYSYSPRADFLGGDIHRFQDYTGRSDGTSNGFVTVTDTPVNAERLRSLLFTYAGRIYNAKSNSWFVDVSITPPMNVNSESRSLFVTIEAQGDYTKNYPGGSGSVRKDKTIGSHEAILLSLTVPEESVWLDYEGIEKQYAFTDGIYVEYNSQLEEDEYDETLLSKTISDLITSILPVIGKLKTGIQFIENASSIGETQFRLAGHNSLNCWDEMNILTLTPSSGVGIGPGPKRLQFKIPVYSLESDDYISVTIAPDPQQSLYTTFEDLLGTGHSFSDFSCEP